jgi:hypothetical protein
MSTAIWGTVVDGKVVPESILPEGAHVQIVLPAGRPLHTPLSMTPDLQAELDAWQQGSAQAMELIDQIPDEELPRETR